MWIHRVQLCGLLHRSLSLGVVQSQSRARAAAIVRVAGALREPRLPAVLRAVRPCVLAEMVRAHESFVAEGALESLLPGVCAQVPLELVRARKAFPAEKPVADKRPLPGVPAQVGLQVRSFAVNFTTTWDVAAVQAPPPGTRAPLAEALRLLAVWTVTSGSTGVAP